jgi:hypothetical protein
VTPRRPVFGWIAFILVALAALSLGGALVYGYLETRDAFEPGPPWFAVSATVAAVPVGILCLLALVLGIVAVARRERPGWPGAAAVVLAIPGFGYLAVVAFVAVTVITSCAGPAGACR